MLRQRLKEAELLAPQSLLKRKNNLELFGFDEWGLEREKNEADCERREFEERLWQSTQ